MPNFSRLLFLKKIQRHMHSICVWNMIKQGKPLQTRYDRTYIYGKYHIRTRVYVFLRPPRAGLRGHTYHLLQGPSRLRRRSGAFFVRIVKYWNRLPADFHSWTVIYSKSSLQHLRNFCPHSLTIFSILLPQAIYVFP